MWICPKCKREFKKNNQSHYCIDKPKTIEEYIKIQDEDKQEDLKLMRNIISSVLIDATERISWSMPTYYKNGNILHFAASKNHIGFYVGNQAVETFKDELTDYQYQKGTIRIPYGKLNKELIKKIALWCYNNINKEN